MNIGSADYLQGIFLLVVSETITDIHQSANIIPIENQKEVEIGELKFKDSAELCKSKRTVRFFEFVIYAKEILHKF